VNNIKFKTLNMSKDIDQKILLTYFFKKPNTILDKNELSTMSCICYDSEKKHLYSRTKRFIDEIEPFKNKKIFPEEVDNILRKVLSDRMKIQEELVRCDFHNDTGIDYFYIAVIGVDFFLTETEVRK